MKKRGSIVKTVFVNIDDMVSTVENIHGDIAEKQGYKNGYKIRKSLRRKDVYGVIKSINGRIGNFVSNFF